MRYQGIRSAGTISLFVGTLTLASTVFAEEPKSAAVTPRQMAHCMIQRIHEDRRGERTESYKDAIRACKQDLAADADRDTPTAMNTANAAQSSK
jgi:hypothetical protein